MVLDARPALRAVWIAILGVSVLLQVTMLVLAVATPPATLDAVGVRVRRSAFSVRLTRIPWSEITYMWIAYFGTQRHLALLTVRRESPYLVPILDGLVDRDQLDAAIRQYGEGRVSIANHPPTWTGGWDPDTGRRAAFPRFRNGRDRRPPRALRLAVLVWVVV